MTVAWTWRMVNKTAVAAGARASRELHVPHRSFIARPIELDCSSQFFIFHGSPLVVVQP